MNQVENLLLNIQAYKNKCLKKRLASGLVLSALAILSIWLLFAIGEFFGNFSEFIRTALFYSFLVFSLGLIAFKVGHPLMQLMGLLPFIENTDAAKEIGKELSEVDDKLLNTITLQSNQIGETSTLLRASIDQRAYALNKHEFSNLVSWHEVISLLKILALPVVVILSLVLLSPATVVDSSFRLLNYNESFVPPAPFRFKVQNASLIAIEGEPFELSVITVGRSLPDQAYVEFDSRTVRMKKGAEGRFIYTLDRVSEPISFKLSAAGVKSAPLTINVKRKPKILRNTARISFPSYTQLTTKTELNLNQLTIPEGSSVSWNFETGNVSEAQIGISDSISDLSQNGIGYSAQFLEPQTIMLMLKSEDQLFDTTLILVDVVRDEFPTINATVRSDSTAPGILFFTGEISDDYGISKLRFVVEKTSGNKKTIVKTEQLGVSSSSAQSFSYIGNIDSLSVRPNESFSYYFEVLDNDGINGSKATKSRTWKLDIPDQTELKKLNDKAAAESKSALSKKQEELKKANEDLDKLKKDLLQKKKPDWQDKERLKDLLEDQKKLLDELQKKLKNNKGKRNSTISSINILKSFSKSRNAYKSCLMSCLTKSSRKNMTNTTNY